MHDAEATTTTIKLKQNTLRITQDPLHYGFWKLSLDKGALPVPFQGRYTRKYDAEVAAQRYVASKTKD